MNSFWYLRETVAYNVENIILFWHAANFICCIAWESSFWHKINVAEVCLTLNRLFAFNIVMHSRFFEKKTFRSLSLSLFIFQLLVERSCVCIICTISIVPGIFIQFFAIVEYKIMHFSADVCLYVCMRFGNTIMFVWHLFHRFGYPFWYSAQQFSSQQQTNLIILTFGLISLLFYVLI